MTVNISGHSLTPMASGYCGSLIATTGRISTSGVSGGIFSEKKLKSKVIPARSSVPLGQSSPGLMPSTASADTL